MRSPCYFYYWICTFDQNSVIKMTWWVHGGISKIFFLDHPYSILTGDTRVEFVIYRVLRVIFDQWSKLNLGFDVEPEISILKVIYYLFKPRFSSITFVIYNKSLRNFLQSRKHPTFDVKDCEKFEFRYILSYLIDDSLNPT